MKSGPPPPRELGPVGLKLCFCLLRQCSDELLDACCVRKPLQIPSPAVQDDSLGIATWAAAVVPWPSGHVVCAICVSVQHRVFSGLEAETFVDRVLRQLFACKQCDQFLLLL